MLHRVEIKCKRSNMMFEKIFKNFFVYFNAMEFFSFPSKIKSMMKNIGNNIKIVYYSCKKLVQSIWKINSFITVR